MSELLSLDTDQLPTITPTFSNRYKRGKPTDRYCLNWNQNIPLFNRIVDLYKSGLSIHQVSSMIGLGLGSGRVKYVVGKHGITRSISDGQIYGCRSKTRVSPSWSFIPLNPDKAWMLGLIFGDGCLRRDLCQLIISSGDYDVIHKVDRLFNYKLYIKNHSNVNCISAQINSRRLCNELLTFGLCPNKSKVIKFPPLNHDVLPHFVRGLLDSDGCWTSGKQGHRLNFRYCSASSYFVQQLRLILIEFCNVSDNAAVYIRKNKASHICFGSGDSLKIGYWIYQDSSVFNRSDRKYKIWIGFNGK